MSRSIERAVLTLFVVMSTNCTIEESDSAFGQLAFEHEDAVLESEEDLAAEGYSDEDLTLLPVSPENDALPVIASYEAEPDASIDRLVAEDDPQNACWVTLNYCTDPSTGTPTCSQNGQCSWDLFVVSCHILICDYCGC